MSTPEVVAVGPYQDLYAHLDTIPTLTTYVEQWACLKALRHRAVREPEMSEALLEYAARPSGSQLIRAYALDVAVGASVRAVKAFEAAPGPSPTPAQIDAYKCMRELAPAYFEPGNKYLYNDAWDTWDKGGAYFWFFKSIAAREGLDPHLVTPSISDLELDGYLAQEASTNVPLVASTLLSRLIGSTHPTDSAFLSPEVGRDALELVLNFRSDAFRQAVTAHEYSSVVQFSRLRQFTKAGGGEHDGPIDFLYQLPEERRFAYARTFNRLYEVQAKLGDFFPGIDVTQAARALVANALFAVEHHVRADMSTTDTLQLKGGSTVPVSFAGDQPIKLLDAFIAKLERAHAKITHPDVQVTVAVDRPDFTIFDYETANNADPMRVMHYIRPRGGNTCNYRYEYGGRRSGVMASMDWRIDEGTTDPTRPYHRQSRTADYFSIRLDRDVSQRRADGFLEPDYEEGTVSLDVGSLQGTGFGHELGVLLAFGNKLRSAAVGQAVGLNHQTAHIDQQFGRASRFAAIAEQQRQTLYAVAGQALAGSGTAALASLALDRAARS